jgi:cystatin-A/B
MFAFVLQLVNGVNYFIKVKVGDNEAVHVRAHKAFKEPHPTLHSIQSGKTLEDNLEYF